MKLRNPLVLHHITLQRGVSFTLNPTMETKEDPGLENLNTDLLVLTQMSGAKMSHGMCKIDALLAGKLSESIEESGFTGKAGQSVLLDSGSLGSKQKWILLIGLGDVPHFNGRTVCAMMRLVLEVADEKKVTKITMPIFPNRQTEDELNLAGTAATLVCRVNMFAAQLPELKEVELFCTPQARRHLQDGLFGKTPRCMVCLNPELGTA